LEYASCAKCHFKINKTTVAGRNILYLYLTMALPVSYQRTLLPSYDRRMRLATDTL
jgi:hypothetical protein